MKKQPNTHKNKKSVSRKPQSCEDPMPSSAWCTCCGGECSGKLNIEARKGVLYPFCTACFDSYMCKDTKEIRRMIRENKDAVTI